VLLDLGLSKVNSKKHEIASAQPYMHIAKKGQ
jgi:hypothetical protein